jgi:hypothetical protein
MFLLKDNQKAKVSFTALSAAGNPAAVEDAKLQCSDESVLTVVDNLDGTFDVVTTGKLGVAQLSVTADALIGEGVETLVGMADVEVVAGKAVKVEVVLGAPEDKIPLVTV